MKKKKNAMILKKKKEFPRSYDICDINYVTLVIMLMRIIINSYSFSNVYVSK